MSSPKYQPQIYQILHCPSGQLKTVLDYFDWLKRWDFETIPMLSTPFSPSKPYLRPWVFQPGPRARI